MKSKMLAWVSLAIFFLLRDTQANSMRLQLEPGTKAVIKLGVCPYPNFMQRCGDSKQDDCLDDLDCAHESLCCNDGCRRSCSKPRMENVVGYIVLGAELPLSSPTMAPSGVIHNSKSLSVSSDSWSLLLNYLCAVADRLHSTNQFQCKVSCNADSDCPNSGSEQQSGIIKCCNRCCLDPTQFIMQQRSNMLKNETNKRTTFHDSSYTSRVTEAAPLSKPGMCPPVLVQNGGNFAPGACERRCSADRECYGPEKCCSNGCGYACQRPISFSLGYGESLAAPIPSSSTNYFPNPTKGSPLILSFSTTQRMRLTTTTRMRMNSPLPFSVPAPATVTPRTQPNPITVLLGAQPTGSTDSPSNSKRCLLPPTSYTECIGITPWRTRYYYHKNLNQCLPIYRCIRNGNNFQDLSSCENMCVEKSDFLY